MNFQPADTVLDHVRIRAAHRGEVSRLADALKTASWPARSDRSWVIIRSVHVRGLPGGLADRAAGLARDLASGAVDGRLPAASNALAVRFPSLDHLLASLLADMAAGRAHTRWYWRQWMRSLRLPPSQAIARLLTDHAAHAAAIAGELEVIGALSEVWQSLSPDGARQVLVELSRIGPAPVWRPVDFEAENVPARPGARGVAAEIRLAPYWPRILRRWRGALAGIGANDSRFQLAVALIGLECFSIYLSRGGGDAFATIGREFRARMATPRREAPLETPAPRAPAEPESAAPGARPAPRDARAAGPDGSSDSNSAMTFPRRDTVEPPPEAAPLTSPGDENLAPTPAPGETAAAVAISLVPQRAPVLREPPAKTTGDGAAHGEFVFHTRQGGVFYLINALNHPSVRALLDDAEAWTSLPSGWAWLFRLGESLGLDIHDPVASFFARESGLESALQLDDLGQLPMREALLDLCARVYAPHGVWQPELLAIEGRVTPTSSHLDVEFPMSAVRLPVRLAGLDLNPGWTPWLGRVVTFHYVSVREGDRL